VRVHPETEGAFALGDKFNHERYETHERTARYYKKIEDVKVGDVVLAWNEKTGQLVYSKVQQVFVREANAVYKVRYKDKTVIETTKTHPFYIAGKSWVESKYLKEGMQSPTPEAIENFNKERSLQKQKLPLQLISYTDRNLHKDKEAILLPENLKGSIAIESVEVIAGNREVYNFSVEENHNYFVSESEVLVHNEKYTVLPGDTIYSISQKRGLNWKTVAKANGLKIMDNNKVNIKIGDNINLPDYKDSLNPVTALDHYKNGNGQSLIVPFSSLDTSRIDPLLFNEIGSKVIEAKPGVYQINASGYRKVLGIDAFTYGTIKVNVNGKLTIDKNRDYSFEGTFSSDHDIYDFDSRNTDDSLREPSVKMGQQMHGTPYYIYFQGAQNVQANGTYNNFIKKVANP